MKVIISRHRRRGVLFECLANEDVKAVLIVSRRPTANASQTKRTAGARLLATAEI